MIDVLVESLVEPEIDFLIEGIDSAPINFALITAGASSVDGGPFVTDSVTLLPNRLYALVVTASAATAESPNSVTGAGLTWTASTAGSNGGANRRTSWFYGFGAPTPGAITMGFAGTMTGVCWSLFEVVGAKLQAPRQGAANNANSTTVTGTLAGALASTRSGVIYCCGRAVQEDTVPPANFTELVDHPVTSHLTPANIHQVAWGIGQTSAAPTWATSGAAQIVILEFEAA